VGCFAGVLGYQIVVVKYTIHNSKNAQPKKSKKSNRGKIVDGKNCAVSRDK